MKFRANKKEFSLGFGIYGWTDDSWMIDFAFGFGSLLIEIPVSSVTEKSYGIYLFKDEIEKGVQVSTGYDTKVWSF